jgi:glycosyltransferase involved in cell wall biosynthesis
MAQFSTRVSVVIPVKDDEELLERCLRALAGQTAPPDEIVVVDNGSVRSPAATAARWGARCIVEPVPGIPAASAAGFDAAREPILARLDADSMPDPDWCARIRSAFENDHALVAITGPGVFPSLPPALGRLVDLVYMRAYFGVFRRVIGRVPVFGSNFAMSADAWRHARDLIHRDDAEVHDDLDLSFHLPRTGPVRFDHRLTVGISARPFARPGAFVRRVWRGIRTVHVNRLHVHARRARVR